MVLSDAAIPTAVEETADAGLPQEFALEAAYPNPFNASVQIPFVVWQVNTPVELTVHDVLGRTVRTLTSGTVDARGDTFSTGTVAMPRVSRWATARIWCSCALAVNGRWAR